MPLYLRKRTDSDLPDSYAVWSGGAIVGLITRTTGGGEAYWIWSITGFHVHPRELGPGSGMAPTRDEAMADFATRWRGWLAWAELQERPRPEASEV
jgi:hypothetical protein